MQYPGGKGKTYQHIINLIPPHNTYIEAFLGSGAVLKNKLPASRNIAIEINKDVLNAFDSYSNDIELVNDDAIKYLIDFPFIGKEVVYCDPPYYPSTRYRKRVYRYDFNEKDHIELLNIINILPCRVLISGYDNDLYQEKLSAWSRYEFFAKTHKDRRKEIVWFNYPKPNALHDNRYLGSNFRDRQNFKRRKERLKKRISRLSPPEIDEILKWLTQERGRFE